MGLPEPVMSVLAWSREPRNSRRAASCLLLVDCIVTLLEVQAVPHFNIDWSSYMQQAGNLSSGVLDYSQLLGDNGPLVYPAGHAWLYLSLHQLTGQGADSRLAQYLATAVYVTNLALVFRLLLRTEKVPPYLLALLSVGASRQRTLTVIHLFNDPVSVLLLHAAINMFLDRRWSLGSLLFSLAVSVKMNILLFAPGLLCIYLTSLPPLQAFLQLAICASVQLLLAAPFLLADPLAYLSAAFNLNRSFLHRDSVNYGFLPRDVFTSKWFHAGLLALHISALLYSARHWWKPLRLAHNYFTETQTSQNNNISSNHTDKSGSRDMFKMKDRSGGLRWQSHFLVFLVSLALKLLLSLPPFHPLLIHLLFWPSAGLVLALPAGAAAANLLDRKLFAPTHPQGTTVSDSARHTNAVLLPLFMSNFIGIVCSRSVHVQFYSWYFYSLHYLLCHTSFSTKFKLLLLSFIEGSYFSLEIHTVLGYLFTFGPDRWQDFEGWATSACQPFISKERNEAGFEVELQETAPDYCRRGSAVSSLVFQAAHWAILINLLWQSRRLTVRAGRAN